MFCIMNRKVEESDTFYLKIYVFMFLAELQKDLPSADSLAKGPPTAMTRLSVELIKSGLSGYKPEFCVCRPPELMQHFQISSGIPQQSGGQGKLLISTTTT